MGNIRFSKALIFTLQSVGERNVANQLGIYQLLQRHFLFTFRRSTGVYGSGGQIVKRLASAGAEIVNAGNFGVVEEKQVYFHHIFYADKIAALLAFAIAIVSAEQVNIALLAVLVALAL